MAVTFIGGGSQSTWSTPHHYLEIKLTGLVVINKLVDVNLSTIQIGHNNFLLNNEAFPYFHEFSKL